MDLTLDIAVAAIAIGPFIAALVAPSLRRVLGAACGWLLAIVPALIFAYLCTFIEPVAAGQTIHASLSWAPVRGMPLSFLIDGLSLVFALTVSGIGTLILIYSSAYLSHHPHQGRYFAFMLMFMGAMLGLVLADSTIALYAFWELTTFTSFLLIGFDHTRQAARRAAIQALVVTTAGGLALLAAAILIQRLTGSWELSQLAVHELQAEVAYPVILGLVLLAAFTKSAQLPFHFWLPNAMEAPTPVSAFLHSATMVQGGVYLLARLHPALGGTTLWSTTLIIFGGATLLWGGVAALRQTDLKQMLAQTTLASLGLLVLLLGIGSEAAIVGAVLYFLGHALYKAALFLVVGIIDHETGTRDITALSGLRDSLTITFIAAALAAFSMIGLPPLLGYLAKEEMYAALLTGAWQSVLVLGVLIIGNALLAAVALAVLIKPFMGTALPLPKEPREASPGLLAGPAAFAIVGLAAGFVSGQVGTMLVAPAAAAVVGAPVESHLGLHFDLLNPVLWLSLLTWLLGALLYWRLDLIRTVLRRGQIAFGWTFDKGFDAVMLGLIRLSGAVTRFLHHGQLELYLVLLFFFFALAILAPLWALGGLPEFPAGIELTFYEAGIVFVAVIGIAAVVAAPTRLFGILALGIQGLAVALLYLLFGAPDLSFTQFMVEVLSVVILTLVMTRLRLDRRDPRPFEDLARDGGLALVCGLATTTLLFAVLQGSFDPRLSEFFNAHSVGTAHGHNVVNVILVDFRGLDTLGEISVVMTAGIAILALIQGARRAGARAPRSRTRKSRARTEAAT